MKKFNLLTVLIMLVFASVSFGQISSTVHNFSGAAWNNGDQICQPCHTPHNANLDVSGSPLWNHEVTDETFTVYTSATLDADPLGQPTGDSKLCLSCHDGATAMDNFGNNTPVPTTMGAVAGNLGTSLMNDHPISFDYNATTAATDGGLHDPTTTNSGLGSFISVDMLSDGVMQCSSCHDPHTSAGKFLVMSNAASALCLTCHNK